MGHQLKAMGDYTDAGEARPQGAGGVHSASFGSPRGGGRAGGRLTSEVKVTIGGNTAPRLGGDVVIFEDMRELLVAYLENGQQMHFTREDGRDRVLARRRELMDSSSQMMVDGEFNDGRPWIDLSQQELKNGLQTFAGVDVQQTRDVDFAAISPVR